MPEATLNEVADAIADRIQVGALVVALTGAGVSAASGLPTFRGDKGLWSTFRPDQVATAAVLQRDPELLWRFHDHLRGMLLDAVPNATHFVLAEMEEYLAGEAQVLVITQNIDYLHQRAGSTDVIELHGEARTITCMACGMISDDLPYPAPAYPPRCGECGGILRPNVVLYGEPLPADALERARGASSAADVMLVIGTSATVEPAASLPFLALAGGALVVEINPENTTLTGIVHYSVQAPSSTALPALWERVQEKLPR